MRADRKKLLTSVSACCVLMKTVVPIVLALTAVETAFTPSAYALEPCDPVYYPNCIPVVLPGPTGPTGATGAKGDSFDVNNALALDAALSMPAWLQQNENFSISGGVGFAESSAAIGVTGVMRLDKNWSGFAGGGISTEDDDIWAGKAGVRVGW